MKRAAFFLIGLGLAGCASPPARSDRRSVDEGYLLGMADAVKQLYWAKQALEAPGESRPAGTTQYYTWEDSGTTRDGRKLAPETVSVPVFVPAPVPSGGGKP
jgi:hypothetical protein